MSGGGTRKRKSGQHREYLYRLLVDAAIGYAIFTLDDQGKIATWNSGAERLTGYEEGEVLGKEATSYSRPRTGRPGWIEMEITERALMETADGASILEQLNSMGIQISVNDFGTGYSALSYVRHFPIDIVKIDQSLIKHLPNSREDAAIVAGIVEVACNLGLKVIAEGVETPEQLAFLKKHNCTRAQGFLFHPPVPASELAKLMEKGGGFHLHP